MATRKTLTSEDKLAALRKGHPARKWESLDDRCTCILCEKSFSGRQVDVAVSPIGRVRLRCPSDGCPGTPREWVRPGNPLVSQQAWRDWERVLNGGGRSLRSKVTKPSTALGVTA
ncbi:hypothetical protein BH20VER2_BH20VER2_09430 [soil metagenome]